MNDLAADDIDGVQVRLRDVMNMILGTVIFLTPWFNGDAISTHGSIRLRFIALAIVIVSLWIVMHQRQVWAEWVNAVLGALLTAAPIWRHGGVRAEHLDSAIGGTIVFAFALSCALQLHRAAAAAPPVTVSVVRSGRNS